MFLRLWKKCISFAAFSASSRKSSSRARFRLRSSKTHPNSKDLGNSQAATVDSADSVAMSAATAASRPRYCTLTATCRPSCRRALCTCNHSFIHSLNHDRLPKKLLFGEVKGLRPPGRPRSSFNDVALRDCQNCRISRPYRDAQDRLLWRDKTRPART